MVKSGLIFAAVSLLVAFLVTLLLPYCVPCLAPFLAVGAGYLAGVFSQPADQASAAKAGAAAGALGGAGALLGHLLGGAANALLVGPEGAVETLRGLGLPAADLTPGMYYGVTFGLAVCLGLIEIALMAGVGALGGLLWWQARRPRAA